MIKPKFILHPGPGKSGSTWLQKAIFPDLHNKGLINFLNLDITNTDIARFLKVITTINFNSKQDSVFLSKEIKIFNFHLNNYIQQSKVPVVLSMEALHGWDPGTWEQKLLFNKYLFTNVTSSASILLTFRETNRYLSNVFLQQKKLGEDGLTPSQYFLKKNEYIIMRKLFGELSCGKRIFSIEDLDYEKLYNLYKKEFPYIYAASLDNIINLDFLVDLNICSQEIANNLTKKYKNKIYNHSLSTFTFTFIKYREKLLSKIGLIKFGRFFRQILIANYIFSSFDSYNIKMKPIIRNENKKFKYSNNFIIFNLFSNLKLFIKSLFGKIKLFKRVDLKLNLPKKIIDKNNRFLLKLPLFSEHFH